MTTLIRDAWKISLLCGVALLALAGDAQSQTRGTTSEDLHTYYVNGQNQAAADLKNGVYVIKTWGLQEAKIGGGACAYPSKLEIEQRILTEKYKVKFEVVGGCMLVDSEVESARGYNEAIEKALNAKYGEDVFEKAETDAAKEFEKKYSKKQGQCEAWLEGIKNLPARRPQINQQPED